MKLAAALFALVGLTVCFADAASAQEWTRFRGPNGTGVSDAKGIPTKWTDADYNWKVTLPGIGHSSPVLWGTKLFITSGDPKTGARIILCIDGETGKTIWQKDFAAATHKIHLQNSFASSTPAVDAECVYFAWATPDEFNLLALDHAGNEKWRTPLGKYSSNHGFGTSPIVYEDLVVIANEQDAESSIVAVDRETGKIRWQISRKTKGSQNTCYSTPCVHKTDAGEELIFNSWAHGICGIDPKTGGTNWEANVFERRPVSSPVMAGGLILGSCGEGSGNNYVVAVKPGSKGKDGEVAYKVDKVSAPYVPTMVAHKNNLFLWSDRGFLTCIDAATGKQHFRQRTGGGLSGSPICVNGYLYAITQDGEAMVIEASPTYNLVSKVKLADTSRATPAVANGKLYLRTETTLYSLGGKK